MTEHEIRIPEGTTVEVNKNGVVVKGKLGELRREFRMSGIKSEQKNSVLVISIDKPKTKEKAYIGSIAAHIKNMIKGINDGHKYKLKIVYKHFPINVSVEKGRVVIKNFSGEKNPREARICDGVKVSLKGEIIEVEGNDIEKVGQTAANIEKATKIRKRDIRVFQDGIFIIQKGEE